MTKRVAIYVRHRLGSPDNFDLAIQQAERLKQKAAEIGEVVETHIDDRDNKARPSWKMLLDACRAGKIDVIMTRSISRIGRNVADIAKLIRELDEIGVTFYFDADGIYTGADVGKNIFDVLTRGAAAH